MPSLLRSLRDPIPEIALAAHDLGSAVDAHLAGDRDRARELLLRTNTQVLRDYIDSMWGKRSPYLPKVPPRRGPTPPRVESRMPPAAALRALHQRDGFHCRFCGIPVIRVEVRKEFQRLYPELGLWGRTNAEQHAAFQVLWAQYDHLVPHAWGGSNAPDNMVVACAGCNYARMQYLLEEVGVADPRGYAPVRSTWDGLERLLPEGKRCAGMRPD